MADLEAMRSRFESGETRPLKWRKAQLEQVYALITENSEQLCQAMAKDLGKSAQETRITDLNTVDPAPGHN
jgi:aldehyde dehydrogenase (NAD+)